MEHLDSLHEHWLLKKHVEQPGSLTYKVIMKVLPLSGYPIPSLILYFSFLLCPSMLFSAYCFFFDWTLTRSNHPGQRPFKYSSRFMHTHLLWLMWKPRWSWLSLYVALTGSLVALWLSDIEHYIEPSWKGSELGYSHTCISTRQHVDARKSPGVGAPSD